MTSGPHWAELCGTCSGRCIEQYPSRHRCCAQSWALDGMCLWANSCTHIAGSVEVNIQDGYSSFGNSTTLSVLRTSVGSDMGPIFTYSRLRHDMPSSAMDSNGIGSRGVGIVSWRSLGNARATLSKQYRCVRQKRESSLPDST